MTRPSRSKEMYIINLMISLFESDFSAFFRERELIGKAVVIDESSVRH